MPSDKSFGLDRDQSVTPVEKPAQRRHQPTSGIIGPPGFNLPFLKHRELLPEKQVLGGERGAGLQDEKWKQTEWGNKGRHRL